VKIDNNDDDDETKRHHRGERGADLKVYLYCLYTLSLTIHLLLPLSLLSRLTLKQ